jgi:hypothetical protein
MTSGNGLRSARSTAIAAGLSLLLGCVAEPEQHELEAIESSVADPIALWNRLYDDACLAGFGGPQTTHPGLQIRGSAMLHVSMFDAVALIQNGPNQPYGASVPVPQGASAVAAAHAAAHRAMVLNFDPAGIHVTGIGLYDILTAGFPRCLVPGTACSRDVLDAALAEALADIPDGQAKQDGIAVGVAVADQIFHLRVNDGTFETLPPNLGGPRAGQIGYWVPTPPQFQPAFMEQWVDRVPWAMTSPAQFRPGPPPALTSARYTADYNEVKAYGHALSTVRTPDQTDAALAVQGMLPAYIYHPIARQLMAGSNLTLYQRARFFALLAMAADDATISSLNTKFHYSLWRPITAIQLALLDGNLLTTPDLTWQPLIITPPFAEYTSAHAVVSQVYSHLIAGELGDNHDVSFTANEFFLHTTIPTPNRTITRSFTSISAVATEVVNARVWAGIHYRFADLVGKTQGTQVANWVLQNAL